MAGVDPRNVRPLCFPWEVYQIHASGKALFQDEFQTEPEADRYVNSNLGQGRMVAVHYTRRPRRVTKKGKW